MNCVFIIFYRAIVITSEDQNTSEKDIIEIAPHLVQDVFTLFENDYSKMASYLKQQGDKVVLLNPRVA